MNSFLVKLILLFLILSSMIFGLDAILKIEIPTSLHFFNLGYLVFTLLSHRVLMKSNEQSGSRFTTAFMGSVTMKLLLTMAALGLYIYFADANKAVVGIGVFVIYMAYTVSEVAYMQKVLRK